MTDRPIALRGAWCVWFAVAAAAGGLGACGEDPPSAPPVRTPDDAAAAAGSSALGTPDAGAGDTDVSNNPERPRPPLLGGFDLPDTGSLDAEGDCTPGETRECVFEQLCSGVATCSADGQSFGACSCGSTPLDGSGGIVGAACRSDADCSSGATCLSAASNGWRGQGGPAGGYCTFSCVAEPDDCAAHDPWSRCVPLGPNGSLYCIRTCLSKDADPGEAKCLNRPDLACVSTAADQVELIAAERQPGYCAPRCGSDEECPIGRFCHRQGGVCTNVLSPGAPSGSRCELTTDCDGRECLDRAGGVGVCSALCVLGSLSGCGYGPASSAREVGCVTPLVSSGRFSEGPGDLGLCQELCDVDADCLQDATGFGCRPLNGELASFLGRSGACVPRPAAN